MISIARIKFKYNKAREGLREINDLIDSVHTKTRPHEGMSCRAPSDASEMTLYEKVLQMHIVTLTELTGRYRVTEYTRHVEDSIRRFPVGGVIFYDRSLKTAPQVLALTSGMQRFYRDQTGIPLFVCVDEEGGVATRVGRQGFPEAPHPPAMGDLAAREDAEAQIRYYGDMIGHYLNKYGFNVDFAPIADVVTNGNNTFLKKRAFGTEPERVKELVYLFSQQLLAHGVLPCYKHFPGIGGTNDNSHFGYATVNRTLEQFEAAEFIPFRDACEKGIPFIMSGHILVPAITTDNRPASLSKTMLTDILRKRLGFRGIILCDALVMDAVRNDFSSCRASVEAIKAGCDMVMKPGNFRGSVNTVIEAVENGEISETRINESVNRILRIKRSIN
jgi:beta-N-acetylhexosaminidase